MHARLVPIDGGRPIRLEKELTIIGRKRWVCDIYLRNVKVSKLHCMIYQSHGRLLIQDFGSSNGTKINGKKITVETELYNGDEIEIADAAFELCFLEDRPDQQVDSLSRQEPEVESSLMADVLDEINPASSGT